MTAMTDAIPLLAQRAEALARAMLALAGGASPPLAFRRRALALAVKCRALAAALALAEGDDVLTAANELTDLEEAAHALSVSELDTVRPPPSRSGTFVIERKKVSTNRLLAVRG